MIAKKRDYAADYRRRIEKGLAKGLSRQEARGHGPKKGLKATTKLVEIRSDDPLHRAFEAFRKGAAITPTAKSFHISPEKFRRFVTNNAEVERKAGRLRLVKDKRQFLVPMFSNGKSREVTVFSPERDRIAAYLSAVDRFLKSNNASLLAPFQGQKVRDVRGKSHRFETDPYRLYEIVDADEFDYSVLYKGLVVL